MKRCTACFRFHPGTPTFCAYCGRSFDVRICSRGHRNPRGVQYCAECGSGDLSTPMPPTSLLYRLSGFVVCLFVGLTIALIVVTAVLSIFNNIDWQAIAPHLVALVLMVGFLYWTTTLLPGPVKRLGKAAGRQVMKSVRKKKQQ